VQFTYGFDLLIQIAQFPGDVPDLFALIV